MMDFGFQYLYKQYSILSVEMHLSAFQTGYYLNYMYVYGLWFGSSFVINKSFDGKPIFTVGRNSITFS